MTEFSGWRKASYSSEGNCVEVARAAEAIGVRDSKDKAGPVLEFSSEEWTAFLATLR